MRELREFFGYRQEAINLHLETMNELAQANLPVNEQIKEFKKKTGKGRSTFFNYKAFLAGKSDFIGLRRKQKQGGCFFCAKKKGLVVHHKDKDRHNNQPNNLVWLCPPCHSKLHALSNKVQRSAGIHSLGECE